MAENLEKGMVDLGRPYDGPMGQDGEASEKKINYPTLYIRGIEENPDFPKGDFYATVKVRAISVTEREANDDDGDEKDGEPDIDYDCELEVHGIKVVGATSPTKVKKEDSGDSLNKAFNDIQDKKAKVAPAPDAESNDEDASESGEE